MSFMLAPSSDRLSSARSASVLIVLLFVLVALRRNPPLRTAFLVWRDSARVIDRGWPPAPFHVVPRGWAGPNLLAMILFEKYGAHQPLNRQRDRYAREGVDLSTSTLADQVGACTVALKPLHDPIAAHVLAASRLHGDDTTVPVLAKGETDTARAWVYVRDDKPFAGPDPPAALFRYSRDRSGDHPVEHLQSFAGILQADAYAGYRRLYEHGRSPRPVTEALCWAHGRRKFYELADIAASKRRGKRAPPISPLALEAVKRIDALFDIEREINGETAERRLAMRHERGAPLVAEFEAWMRTERAALSRHAAVAKAMDYMLKRWDGFARFLDDGRICIDEQRRRAGAAPPMPRETFLALRRVRPRRRAGRSHVHPHRYRQVERRRPSGLARRRPRPDRRPAADPAAPTPPLELEG